MVLTFDIKCFRLLWINNYTHYMHYYFMKNIGYSYFDLQLKCMKHKETISFLFRIKLLKKTYWMCYKKNSDTNYRQGSIHLTSRQDEGNRSKPSSSKRSCSRFLGPPFPGRILFERKKTFRFKSFLWDFLRRKHLFCQNWSNSSGSWTTIIHGDWFGIL